MDSDLDDDFEIAALALVVVGRSRRSRLRRGNVKIWVRDIFRLRQQHGQFHKSVQEMRLLDRESHFRYISFCIKIF